MPKNLTRQASAMLIVVIALAIIAILFFLSTRKNEPAANKTSSGFLKDAGVDASSYKSALDSTKKVIADAQASRADLPR